MKSCKNPNLWWRKEDPHIMVDNDPATGRLAESIADEYLSSLKLLKRSQSLEQDPNTLGDLQDNKFAKAITQF